jgi:predicted AAA+ superfamily ATPase
MIRRNIEASSQQALADTPVVLLKGARQTGKTTLGHAKNFSRLVPRALIHQSRHLWA